MTIRFESERWPLVEAVFEDTQSADDIRGYLVELGRVLDRRERYVMFTDAGNSPGIPATSRAEMAGFIQGRSADFDAYQLGHGIFLRSSIQRGMLTALTWVAPMPGNVRTFSSRDDALSWLEERWETVVGERIRVRDGR